MFGQGFFINGNGSNSGNQSEVKLDGNKVIFSPTLDNIFIDDNNSVFYSEKNANAYLSIDSTGNVIARKVM